MGEQLLTKPRIQLITASTNADSDASFARQAEVCIDWSSFLSLGCQLQGCGVPFVCCRRLCVAVRRGSPLSESDGPLACSMLNLTAHVGSCMSPSGAMVPRRGVSFQCIPLKRCRCSQCMRMTPCLMYILPEGRACLVHVRAWRCVIRTLLGMCTLIIVSFGTSF